MYTLTQDLALSFTYFVFFITFSITSSTKVLIPFYCFVSRFLESMGVLIFICLIVFVILICSSGTTRHPSPHPFFVTNFLFLCSFLSEE